jgi:hypothetical protein
LNLGLFANDPVSHKNIQRSQSHVLLDSPIERIERKNADVGIETAVCAALDEELSKIGNVTSQDGGFLDDLSKTVLSRGMT